MKDYCEILFHLERYCNIIEPATNRNLAFDTPNLFRFVYMGESKNYCRGGFNSILTDKGNAVLIDKLYPYLNISREQAEMLFQRMIVYTHGMVSLVVAGGLCRYRHNSPS